MVKTDDIPQSQDAERSVLGAMLQGYEDVLQYALEYLHEGLFYQPRHQLIFQAIQDTARDGAVDLITVTDKLQRSGDMDKAGGRGYISGLLSAVAATENIHFYGSILKDQAARRGLLTIGTRITDMVTRSDPDELAASIKRDLDDIERISSNGAVDTAEILPALHRRREAIAQGKNVFIESGLYDLDKSMSGGFPVGYPVLIKGEAGKGKTPLMLQVLDQMVNVGRRVLLISMEMRQEDVWPRVVGGRLFRVGAVDNDFDYSCLWNTGEWIAQNEGLRPYENYTQGWHIDDRETLTPQEILKSINHHIREHGVEVVAIDHLNMISHPRGHTQQDKEQIIEDLRALCKAKRIVLIWLIQQHVKDRKEYYYTTVRHHSGIVLEVSMTKEGADAQIEIVKNRFGLWGKRKYKFYGGVQTYARPEGGGYHSPDSEFRQRCLVSGEGNRAPEDGAEIPTQSDLPDASPHRGPVSEVEEGGDLPDTLDLDEDVDFF